MGVAGDKSWWWGFIQQKTKPVQPVGKMLLVDYVDVVGVHSCTEGRGNIQCGTIVTRGAVPNLVQNQNLVHDRRAALYPLRNANRYIR